MDFEERLDLGEQATFVPNKKLPVYNWFYYKEGFARDLVFHFIKDFSLNEKSVVLDPFCGSGTTLLGCKEKGINAIGFDVLPVSVFSSRVKTQDYDLGELKKVSQNFFRERFQKPEKTIKIPMREAFSKYTLEDITFFKEKIDKIQDEKVRDLFLLCLISSAIRASWLWKDGAVLKVRKKHVPPLRFLYKRTIKNMVKELHKFSGSGKVNVNYGDARSLELDNESVDAVITSPPYLNQIDYTKVYEVENFLLDDMKKVSALRSFIRFDEENYFKDMELVIKELYRVCKPGAKLSIIVGNAYVDRKIIDVDEILAEKSEKIGFAVEKIIVLNKRFALVERTEKKGILRESAVILEK